MSLENNMELGKEIFILFLISIYVDVLVGCLLGVKRQRQCRV